MLQQHEITQIEALLVESHDIFARHRFDIGAKEEVTVKLTPKHESPSYSQSLQTQVNLKEDILVELALLLNYDIITTLPFSMYASPIFAEKKLNGKLRLLDDLRKINNLISDENVNNNHPVNTPTDAAQHMGEKTLLCKLKCSGAYPCLPMADQKSREMLALNFASRTFAYRRLSQGLSRALSAFSSIMREYLDRVIKADQCTQYLVDIGIAATNANHLITSLRATVESRTFAYRRLSQGLSRALSAFSSIMREYLDRVIKADQCTQYLVDIGIAATDANHLITSLRATFECIRQAGLKLTMHKCHFGATELDFLGRTITPEGLKFQKERFTNFLEKPELRSLTRSYNVILASLITTQILTKIIRNIGFFLPTRQKGQEGLSDNRTS